MPELSPLLLAWCALALFLGGTVKGTLGIGIPLVAIPLLALAMPVPQAVALLTVPILIANVWQAFYGGHFSATLRRFWPLIAMLVVGTVTGARILVGGNPHVLYAVIGGIVVLFSLMGYFQPELRLAVHHERWLGALVGFASGALGGLSTMWGPPLIIFLVALRLPKDEFIGTIGTLYLLGIIPLAVALGAFHVLGRAELMASAVATMPLFLGLLAGQLLRGRLDQEKFRKGLLATLLLTGLALIRRALFT